MEESNKKQCLFCQRGEDQVPLVQVDFKGQNYWICPQHIPVLIHDPSKLDGLLPGAKDLQAG